MNPWVPERGEAVWIDMDPQSGHEQSGRRPALVLSPASYNGKVGLVLLCPITSRVKGYPFEVRIPDGFEVGGAILADQVKSVDWRTRKAVPICGLPPDVVDAALFRLNVSYTLCSPADINYTRACMGRRRPAHAG